MEPNDETLEGLVETERSMVLTAEEKYGEYFTHASLMVTLLNNLVGSLDIPTRFLFVTFLSQTRKHLTLALFSVVRRHHVQAGMNLRQVLEAGAWAAYALVHEDRDLFWIEGAHGAEVPRRLSTARNAWLTTNYPIKSEEIRRLKEQLNDSIAHANVIYASQTFELEDASDTLGFNIPYFDIENEFRIRMDLLMVANFAMGMIGLLSNINQSANVFRPAADLDQQYQDLMRQHDRLRAEIQTHEDFPRQLL